MRVTEDDELAAFRAEVTHFVEDDIGVEYCRQCYQNRTYPREIYEGIAQRGWLGTIVPESLGGRGESFVEAAVLLEALGTYGYDFGVPILLTLTALENVLAYGTDEQVDRFVPRALTGDVRFSIGVTEPGTGSDAASLATRAVRDGDSYVVDGEKTYQSAANVDGNHVHAYVRTDPDAPKRAGLSALLIPVDAEGVTVTPLPLVARKAAGTNHIEFENVQVPDANLIGDPGQGWEILGHHLIREHTGMAACMVGNAQTAVDEALSAATDRERFGQSVAEFQSIAHRLADMQTAVDAARLMVYRSASAIETGTPQRRLAAQAKLKAGEVLEEVTRAGVQILGGAGLNAENDMQRYWREGRSATIAGGTSEIQRSVIARSMRSESRSRRRGSG